MSFAYDNAHLCGGSIISSNAIATAAHCCKTVAAYIPKLTILAGANNIDNPESGFQRPKVEELIIHPSYDESSLLNDICIIHLAQALILSTEKRTLAVQLPQEGYTATGKAVVSGWGSTSEGGPLSPNLMNVTVPIITDEEW